MTSRARGAFAGAVGGLAGTLAMNYAQRLWSIAVDGTAPPSSAGPHDARDWQERSEHQNSNEIAAQLLASAVVNRELSERELAVAASALHFGFGAAIGAIHGAYAETSHESHSSGIGLGSALWLSADEIAMPLLGLSHSTTRRPMEMHLQSFVAHLVYGLVTERTRRMARSLLPA